MGCAFVQFGTVAEAALAIKKLNRSSILDRPIAVDWAVAKAKFQDPSNNLNNKVAGNSDNFDPDNKEGIKDEPLDQDEIKTEIKEEGDDEDDMEVDQDDSDGDESAGGSGEDSDISGMYLTREVLYKIRGEWTLIFNPEFYSKNLSGFTS